jgi:hypothetical protein
MSREKDREVLIKIMKKIFSNHHLHGSPLTDEYVADKILAAGFIRKVRDLKIQ